MARDISYLVMGEVNNGGKVVVHWQRDINSCTETKLVLDKQA